VQDDPSLNERSEAHEVAKHVGCEEIYVDCGRQEVLETYPELIRAAECPVIDTSCAALLMLARKVHQAGYKVASPAKGRTNGSPAIRGTRSSACSACSMSSPASAASPAAPTFGSPALQGFLGRRRKVQDAIAGRMPGSTSMACSFVEGPFLQQRHVGPAWRSFAVRGPEAQRRTSQEMASAQSFALSRRAGDVAGTIACLEGDRVAMNSSVETRYPFLDEEVFTYLAKLHPNWKMRGLRDKLILRHLAIAGCRARSRGGARRCSGRRLTDSIQQSYPRSSINCSAKSRSRKRVISTGRHRPLARRVPGNAAREQPAHHGRDGPGRRRRHAALASYVYRRRVGGFATMVF